MDTIKNAGNFVSDKLQGKSHEASKEAHENQAKNSEAGVGTRLQAAGEAVSDKAKQHSHETEAEAHKQAATH